MTYIKNTEKLPFLIIGLSVLYQCLCAIQGFDLTDEGHLMSAYQWFGDDPLAAKCGSGYPLTCYIGWLLNGVYPSGGVLMMRMWGILMVTLTEIISYKYLSRYFPAKVVLLGLLIQAVFVSGDPKPFGYNNMTIFFAVMSLFCINEGASRGKWYWLLVGGLLSGTNVFVRLPNITFIAFAVVPFLWNYADRHLRLGRSLLQASVFILGFACGMGLIWLLMMHIGADVLISEFVGSIAGTLHGKSTHSTDSLLLTYLANYWMCVVYAGVVILSAVVFAIAFSFKRIIWRMLFLFVGFEILYQPVYIHSCILGNTILATMNSIAIFGSCYYIACGATKRNVALTAVLLSVIGPLGSDGGFRTMWASTWLALPVGLSGLYDLSLLLGGKYLSLFFVSGQDGHERTKKVSLPVAHLQKAFWCCAFTLLVIVVVKVDHKAYYDPGDRIEKTHSIDNRLTRGIFTVEKKARILNPLMKELDKYVRPGDVMLVYDFSPLIYYMTETKPFAGISWPCVFFGERYVNAFNQAEREADSLPVIVLQRFFSSNGWSPVQRNYYDETIDTNYISSAQTKTIKRFIRNHKYKRVWTNFYYEILLPPNYNGKVAN